MKFQEGDKIVVTATGEKGFVVGWINPKMLTIEVGGTQFPVFADQIDFPYFEHFSKKPPNHPKKNKSHEIPHKEKKLQKNFIRDGVYLSFFPILDKDEFDENIFSHYRVYLLNHTEVALHIHFSVLYKELKDLETKHQLNAFEDLYLFDFSFDRLNDQPKFVFLFSLATPQNQKSTPFQILFKPKPKQFLKLSENTLELNLASFKFQLFDSVPKPEELALPLPTKNGVDSLNPRTVDLSQLSKAGFKITKIK